MSSDKKVANKPSAASTKDAAEPKSAVEVLTDVQPSVAAALADAPSQSAPAATSQPLDVGEKLAPVEHPPEVESDEVRDLKDRIAQLEAQVGSLPVTHQREPGYASVVYLTRVHGHGQVHERGASGTLPYREAVKLEQLGAVEITDFD